MAKRIPEKYISGGMLIGFIILMGFIGYGIWDGAQWQCVKTETIKQVWEDPNAPETNGIKETQQCVHLVRK